MKVWIDDNYIGLIIRIGICLVVFGIVLMNWPGPDLTQREISFPVIRVGSIGQIGLSDKLESEKNIVIDWEYINDFSEYQVELALDRHFQDVIGRFNGNSSPCVIPREMVSGGGLFFYRIQVKKENNEWSMFSRPNWFQWVPKQIQGLRDSSVHVTDIVDSSLLEPVNQVIEEQYRHKWLIIQLLSISLGFLDMQTPELMFTGLYRSLIDIDNLHCLYFDDVEDVLVE